ncbi:MAG: ribose 5-phosphate isomerase A [Candidatus Bathyarchaeia archaeon]
MSWLEEAKRRAAEEAVKHVRDGYVLGLGTGTTAQYAIREIGRRIREEGIRVLCVPTSYQAFFLAIQERIPITTLDEHPRLDLAIDGADQIDESLNLIKGGGAALTREKIVGSVAKEYIIVADETKLVETLGLNHPIPLEILPFARAPVFEELKKFCNTLKLREGVGKAGPVVSDNGNFIVDADCGFIKRPKELEERFKKIPGVIESGLFVGMADMVYVGKKDGSVEKLVKS